VQRTFERVDLKHLIEPPTLIGAAALRTAEKYYSPALLNHCLRSYAWALDYALRHDITFDAELLYVAALMHDFGLVREFDNHSLPFEEAGGHAAWIFGAGAGWPASRSMRASEIICRHMWDEVAADIDPEGHLLSEATSLDISGTNAEAWSLDLRTAVSKLLPRLDLSVEFVRCLEQQGLRKPLSAAARAINSGIEVRMTSNPLNH
jgi:HD superfamily phosphodiesterase